MWFRQDLRLADNQAFRAAAKAASARGGELLCVYVWSEDEEGDDDASWGPGEASRVWLHLALDALDRDIRRAYGGGGVGTCADRTPARSRTPPPPSAHPPSSPPNATSLRTFAATRASPRRSPSFHPPCLSRRSRGTSCSTRRASSWTCPRNATSSARSCRSSTRRNVAAANQAHPRPRPRPRRFASQTRHSNRRVSWIRSTRRGAVVARRARLGGGHSRRMGSVRGGRDGGVGTVQTRGSARVRGGTRTRGRRSARRESSVALPSVRPNLPARDVPRFDVEIRRRVPRGSQTQPALLAPSPPPRVRLLAAAQLAGALHPFGPVALRRTRGLAPRGRRRGTRTPRRRETR